MISPTRTSAARPVPTSLAQPKNLAAPLATGAATTGTAAPTIAPVSVSSGLTKPADAAPVIAPPPARNPRSIPRCAPVRLARPAVGAMPVRNPPDAIVSATGASAGTALSGAAITAPTGAVAAMLPTIRPPCARVLSPYVLWYSALARAAASSTAARVFVPAT